MALNPVLIIINPSQVALPQYEDPPSKQPLTHPHTALGAATATGYCNIGCSKTLLSELGKLPLKLTFPAGSSTFPTTVVNKGEIGLCPKHYLPSGASQGLVQLAPLPFFAEFTCNLQWGKWLCCTLCYWQQQQPTTITTICPNISNK